MTIVNLLPLSKESDDKRTTPRDSLYGGTVDKAPSRLLSMPRVKSSRCHAEGPNLDTISSESMALARSLYITMEPQTGQALSIHGQVTHGGSSGEGEREHSIVSARRHWKGLKGRPDPVV